MVAFAIPGRRARHRDLSVEGDFQPIVIIGLLGPTPRGNGVLMATT